MLFLFAVGVALPSAVAAVLLVLGLREPSKEQVAMLQKRALACLAIVVLGTGAWAAGCGWQIYSAVSGGSTVDPSNKARVLAEGISGLMNCVAAGLVLLPLPFAASVALFVRSRRLARG